MVKVADQYVRADGMKALTSLAQDGAPYLPISFQSDAYLS